MRTSATPKPDNHAPRPGRSNTDRTSQPAINGRPGPRGLAFARAVSHTKLGLRAPPLRGFAPEAPRSTRLPATGPRGRPAPASNGSRTIAGGCPLLLGRATSVGPCQPWVDHKNAVKPRAPPRRYGGFGPRPPARRSRSAASRRARRRSSGAAPATSSPVRGRAVAPSPPRTGGSSVAGGWTSIRFSCRRNAATARAANRPPGPPAGPSPAPATRAAAGPRARAAGRRRAACTASPPACRGRCVRAVDDQLGRVPPHPRDHRHLAAGTPGHGSRQRMHGGSVSGALIATTVSSSRCRCT
jgi:hypothetical protein